MSWTNWVRAWLGNGKQRRWLGRKGRQLRVKPGIEPLEDRTVFSVGVVSLASGTPLATANGQSELSPQTSMSSDGRFTVYESSATNLVANQNQPANNINVFLFDAQQGTTTLISHSAGLPATAADGTSFNAAISGDGSTVAFFSTATDLVSGVTVPSGSVELYLYNTATGVITMASTEFGSSTTGSNGANPQIPPSPSTHWLNTLGYSAGSASLGQDINGLAIPSLSSNGQYIVYIDDATNLAAADTGLDPYSGLANTNVFIYDNNSSDGAAYGTNTLVSHAAGETTTTANGTTAGGGAYASTAAISADGSTVAFTDPGINLVSGQSTDGFSDQLYIWSRINNTSVTGLTAGETVLASHEAGSPLTGASIPNNLAVGLLSDGYSQDSPPTLSANGDEVAYYYAGSNLVTNQGGTASVLNVFRYTVSSNANELVSHVLGNNSTAGSNPQNQVASPGTGPVEATGPQISANGEFIAYANNSDNLVATDWTGTITGAVNVTGGVVITTSSSTADLTNGERLTITGITGFTGLNNKSFVITNITATSFKLVGATGSGTYTSTSGGKWDTTFDNIYEYDAATQLNTLVSNSGRATAPDAGGGTAPSMSSDGRFVAFMDLAIPAKGSLSGAAGIVNVRLFDSQAAAGTQPTIIGQSFDSTSLPPLTGTGSNTPATLAFYASALAPTGISADGSTIIWDGPANAALQTNPSVADNNLNLDVFQTTNPNLSSSSSPPQITSSNSATFTNGTGGTFLLIATGSPTPTFTATYTPSGGSPGALPTGLSLSSTGTLTVSSSLAAGTYNLTITASNGVGTAATQNFTLTVNAPSVPPQITSSSSATFTAGTGGTVLLTASGSPTPTFTATYTPSGGSPGSLPSGLTLSSTGTLTASPSLAAGTYNLTITASNGVGTAATQNFTLTINAPPTITTLSTTFTAAQSSSFQLTANGTGPITFAPGTGSNAPPAWLSLSSSGLLSGTAPAGTSATFTFQVTATNSAGSDTETFTLNVIASPVITTLNTTFTANQPGTFQLTTTGTTPTTFTPGTGANAPPTWLTVSSSGLLSGTAPAGTSGTFTFQVTATNAAGSDTETFTLNVIASPTITTLNTTFTVGQSGSLQLAANGTSPITFTLGTGAPAWLTLSSSGVLSTTGATPNVTGPITFQVTATNSAGSDTETFTLNIVAPPAITTLSTTFTANQPGTFQLTTTGTAPITYTAGTGSNAPPAWLSVSSSGLLSGTAPAGTSGTFTFQVTAINTAGSDTETFTLNVIASPTITTLSTTFTAGQSGTFQLTANGTGPLTFTPGTGSNAPPAWLSVSSSGVLSGTAPAGTSGTFTFQVKAANAAGSDTETFTLNVIASPSITTLSATFNQSQPGAFQLTATGTDPITFTLGSGAPAWLTLSSSGMLSTTGVTPNVTSPITFQVTATNSAGSDTETFILNVNTLPALTTLSTTLTAGQPGTFQLAANGTGPITYTSGTGSNAPPAWLTLSSSGLLSGTAPAGTSGTFTFHVTATNAAGSDTETFTLNVIASPTITTLNTTFTANQPGTFQLTANGTGPITFAPGTGSNAPPAWLSLSSSGLLTGTAPAGTSATFTFQVTATNSAGSDTETFTLNVNAVPALTTLNTTFTAGQPGSTFQLAANGTGPITFTAGTGANAPPAWLAVSSSGLLSGTAPAGTSGTFTFQVTATNSAGSDTETFTLNVIAPPAITTLNTTFTAGQPGTFQLATTGTTPITYTAGTGSNAPPAWLSVSSSGLLSGTAPAGTSGTFTFQVTATNTAGSDTETFTLNVITSPTITTLSTTFNAGQSGTFQLAANGTTPVTYTAGTGSNAPPAWLNLSSSGVLSGTAPAGTSGTFTFQVIASNSVGSDTETFTLNVITSPTITTLNTTFIDGQADTFQLTTTGTTPVTFTPGTGANAPPAWLTLSSSGLLSGTAPVGASPTITFQVTATNSAGSDTETFTLNDIASPAITTLSTTFNQGQLGTFQLAATGTDPMTFTPGTGVNAPPAWLTLSSSGLLTGTAPAGTAGTFTFQVTASNSAGSDTETFTLNIVAPPAITTLNTTFTANQPGTFQLTTTSTAPVTYTAGTGSNAPPAWLTLSSSGLLSGTAPAGTSGTFTFQVTATNSAGSDTETFTLNVIASPTITTLSTTFTAGQSGTFQLTTTGTTPITYTASTGSNAPPAWLTLSSSGLLSGTAPAGTSGTFNFQVTATNSAGADTEMFTLNVIASPTITTLSTTFIAGQPDTFQLTANGTSPLTFTPGTGSNAPPAWLSVSSSGMLSGSALAGTSGTFTFQVTATNSVGTDTETFTLNVITPPAITTLNTTFRANQPGTFQLTANGTGPINYTVGTGSNAPPSWLTVSSSGLLSGTAPAGTSGMFSFQVTATNSGGSDTEMFTLNVVASPTITTLSTTFTAGQPGTFQLAANGTSPITYRLAKGAPAWLIMSSSGVLSTIGATPDVTGPINFVVTASNSIGSDTEMFTLNVNPPLIAPQITTLSTTFTVGQLGMFQLSANGATPVTFILGTGAPAWLTLSSSGVLSTNGPTPNVTGPIAFQVTATNSAGSDIETFTLNISGTVTVSNTPSASNTSSSSQPAAPTVNSTPTTNNTTPAISISTLAAIANVPTTPTTPSTPTPAPAPTTSPTTTAAPPVNQTGPSPLSAPATPAPTTVSTLVGAPAGAAGPSAPAVQPSDVGGTDGEQSSIPSPNTPTQPTVLTATSTEGQASSLSPAADDTPESALDLGSAGIIPARLTATNGVGSDTESSTVTVNPAPAAPIDATPNRSDTDANLAGHSREHSMLLLLGSIPAGLAALKAVDSARSTPPRAPRLSEHDGDRPSA
jgi:hypothetical protein